MFYPRVLFRLHPAASICAGKRKRSGWFLIRGAILKYSHQTNKRIKRRSILQDRSSWHSISVCFATTSFPPLLELPLCSCQLYQHNIWNPAKRNKLFRILLCSCSFQQQKRKKKLNKKRFKIYPPSCTVTLFIIWISPHPSHNKYPEYLINLSQILWTALVCATQWLLARCQVAFWSVISQEEIDSTQKQHCRSVRWSAPETSLAGCIKYSYGAVCLQSAGNVAAPPEPPPQVL